MTSLQDFKDNVMKKKWRGRPSHKSWGSHRILLSDQSQNGGGGVDHPPPPQSAKFHLTVNTSVLERMRTREEQRS
jgi:hypothetical protein